MTNVTCSIMSMPDYVNNVTCPIMLKDTSVSSTSGPAPLPNPSSTSSTSWNWTSLIIYFEHFWTSLIIYFEQVFLFLRVGRFWYLPRRCGTCCRPHCQKEKSCLIVPAKRNHKGTLRRCCRWRWMIMVRWDLSGLEGIQRLPSLSSLSEAKPTLTKLLSHLVWCF